MKIGNMQEKVQKGKQRNIGKRKMAIKNSKTRIKMNISKEKLDIVSVTHISRGTS